MWVTHEHGVLIIAPRGPVTDKLVTGYAELERLTHEVVQAEHNQELLVIADLTDVTFMNSTGLGQLVVAYVHTINQGGRFALCSVQPRVQSLLRITCLDQVFDIYTNRAAAHQAFGLK